jgi:hypothetical protein
MGTATSRLSVKRAPEGIATLSRRWFAVSRQEDLADGRAPSWWLWFRSGRAGGSSVICGTGACTGRCHGSSWFAHHHMVPGRDNTKWHVNVAPLGVGPRVDLHEQHEKDATTMPSVSTVLLCVVGMMYSLVYSRE